MKIKHAILLTTIFGYIFSAASAADDLMITLQAADGSINTISNAAAQHSTTLKNLLNDCPINAPLSLEIVADERELSLLAEVLNTANKATSSIDSDPIEEDVPYTQLRYRKKNHYADEYNQAIESIRSYINPENELTFFGIEDFFHIPFLANALSIDFSSCVGTELIYESHQDRKNILKEACEQAANAIERNDLTYLQKKGAHKLISAIEWEQENIKKRFYENNSIDCLPELRRNPFFIGCSVKELAENKLIDLQYKRMPGVTTDPDLYVMLTPTKDTIISGSITSLEGLVCTTDSEMFDPSLVRFKTLVLAYTFIKHLPANCFQDTQDPDVVDIRHHRSLRIDPHAFRGLNRITCVRLNDNGITALNEKTFASLVNLKKLSLSQNLLTNFESGLISNCTQLETLDLSQNQLTHVEPSMFNACKGLKYLNLSHNPIPTEQIAALRKELNGTNIIF